ncbi:hypothetical protein QAD02_001812 [Eretmocerus hayati]|uniref:Uncharacterized protein n=1 Tax=Eretmocerus hayati TaxID=131215 RepID=A0ACC2NH84_9HYME|nr:hypothetical protein QAD02_001812 [Eretmocerus hayati]
MSKQSTIPFPNRKKINFYGRKDDAPKLDFSNASVKSTPTYTPTVKKIVDISSESESDSDAENVSQNSVLMTPNGKGARRKIETKGENGSSPPKQKKCDTPQTPATLLMKLELDSPKKSAKLAPKKLFSGNKYSEARKALHSSVPETLIGRDEELSKLETFIHSHSSKKTSGSLYVSGPPGTGKTACLSQVMSKPKFKKAFQIIYVNCMTMKTAASIYTCISKELGIEIPKSGKTTKSVIEKYLVEQHKMLLLILDEMDQLETKNQSVLYSIFEWPSKANSKIVLVGISNALDLTDRILPRLQARCELKPTLLHFKPYSKQQILDIIIERLKMANAEDIITGPAMHLLAAKVAAVSGDIRRALDISRKVVENAESGKVMQEQQLSNTCDPEKDGNILKPHDQPVGYKEVQSVLNGVYGGSVNVDSEESSFPLQQKILLCSLMLILNEGKNKDITIARLHRVYKKVCEKRRIPFVDTSEFVNLCSLIETRGILRLITKKEAKLSKISLQWDQDLLSRALQDKALTSEIVNDISCL